MATTEQYCGAMEDAGLTKKEVFFETEQLMRHYGAVKYAAQTNKNEELKGPEGVS